MSARMFVNGKSLMMSAGEMVAHAWPLLDHRAQAKEMCSRIFGRTGTLE